MSQSSTGATNEALLQAYHEYAMAKRAVDEANGSLRSIVKRWKAEGVPTKAMIAAYNDVKLDPDEVARDFRDRLRFLALKNVNITQAELFGNVDQHVSEKARQDADIWDSEDLGYRHGRAGVPMNECPYQPGTEHYVAYVKWWRNGQASIAKELGKNAKQANAGRDKPGRGPGRPPGSGKKQADKPATGRGRGRGKNPPLPFNGDERTSDSPVN